MVDYIPEAPRLKMRIYQRFTPGQHCPSGNAMRLQDMHGLIVIVLLCPVDQELIEFRLMPLTGKHGGEPGILSALWVADRLTELAPLVV
jgi:hypothetical protein